MNWAELVNWNFHCHVKYTVVPYIMSFSWNIDVKMREIIFNNGLSIAANDHDGRPILNFFDTEILLGKSEIDLSGNFAMWIIGWFSNFFKLPIQILLN
jgi:hypothetical protein